jgi:hypothetical protein
MMTYHHQLETKLEFDVFEYLRIGSKSDNQIKTQKIYVRIDKLFTEKMLSILLKHRLPNGAQYYVNYFVFEDVDICMHCLYKMYEVLQQTSKYRAYATSFMLRFEARKKKDV